MSSMKEKLILSLLRRYKKQDFLDMIERALSDKQLTKSGLVYIKPFEVVIDRENNIYMKTGTVMELDGFVSIMEELVIERKKSDRHLEKIWPTFRK